MRDKRGKKEIRAGQFHIRINESEAKMFQYVRDKTGKTFSDIVRDCLKLQYELERVKADEDDIEVEKEPVKEPDGFDFVEDFDYGDEDDEGDFEERWGRF